MKTFFKITVLLIYILTLNDSIVSMEPECSSEYQPRLLNMSELVDLVSNGFSRGSLTFNSSVPRQMYDVFMNGMKKVRSTIPDHESELRIISEKATDLFYRDQLTSQWLMHLNLCCAALLSPNHYTLNFYLTLEGSSIEEGFERFSYLHNNAGSLRNDFYKFRSKNALDEEINFGSFSLTFGSSTNIKWLIDTNCFWMPWIAKKPFLKANTFNKAYTNRIAIAGIPLQDCGYDSLLTASPLDFVIHEMTHADDYFSCKRNPERIFFDTPNDPRDILVTFTRMLWKAVEKGQEEGVRKDSIDDYLLFLILHENISGMLPEDLYEEITSLEVFIATVLENTQKSFEEEAKKDYSTAQSYWQTQLEAHGVKNIRIIRPETPEEHSIYWGYAPSTEFDTELEVVSAVCYSTKEDTEFKHFRTGRAYSREKLNLERSVQFLNSINNEVTVENYYAFLLNKFADFRTLFDSASSAEHP